MISDVNGDQKSDLVFPFQEWRGEKNLTVRTLLSDGKGKFNGIEHRIKKSANVMNFQPILTDLNRDNLADLVFPFQNEGLVLFSLPASVVDSYKKQKNQQHLDRSPVLKWGEYEKIIDVKDVFLMEYPNLGGDGGNPNNCEFCSGLDGVTGDYKNYEITKKEFEWAFYNILKPLNETIKDACKRNKWAYIDGVEKLFCSHGVCKGSRFDV
jgi:hypothetical protein